jgi:hypothetical protein
MRTLVGTYIISNLSIIWKHISPQSILFAYYFKDTHELLKRNLKKTRAKMMACHNTQYLIKDRKETSIAHYGIQHLEYTIDNKVLLDTKNMPQAKFDIRKAG